MFDESQKLVQLLQSSNRVPELICRYLCEIPFLNQFEKTQGAGFMKKLSTFIQFRIFQQEEVILEQNRPVNSLYLLMFGQVAKQQYKKDKNYEIIEQKSSIGEIYFLTRQACKYYFVALKQSLICYITKDNFYKIVKKKNLTMSLLNELLQYPFFTQLQINFIESICQKSQTINYINHQIVYDLDQEADFWYIILSGDFSVQFSYQKKFYPLIILSKGDYFGEIELVKKQTRLFRVQCISNDAILLQINKQNFQTFFLQDQQFRLMIQTNIQNRISSYEEIEKQNIATLSIPQPQIRSRSRMNLNSVHIKIRSSNNTPEPKLSELQSEKNKAITDLLESRTVKKELKKSLYHRIREKNPRLHQFLEKLTEIKQQQSNKKKNDQQKVLPSIQTTLMMESVISNSPGPIFTSRGESPMRIKQLTRNRHYHNNSGSVHTMYQTQQMISQIGSGKYFKLLFPKQEVLKDLITQHNYSNQ